MRLPDERPRQSVANLIGRFERAAKRSSISSPPSPAASRATSVVSHNTGDSAKTEVKERREWPPKSDTNPTEANVHPDVSRSLSPPSLASQQRVAPVTAPPDALSDSNPLSLSNDIVSEPTSTEPTSEPSAESKPESQPAPSLLVTTPEKASGRIAASKSVPDSRAAHMYTRNTASKPAAPPTHPTPTTPSKTTVTKPLNPQNTGQSATSNASTVRAKSRLGAKSPPVTHVKTPNALSSTSAGPATASPASVSRPKTPSSGLYAPTKASLAKARNAPLLPTPARKATHPASALDRLSKPTAASASKARSPTASPPRASAARPVRGAPPQRIPVKPRVGLAPTRMKGEREKRAGETTSVAKSGLPKAKAGAIAAVGPDAATALSSSETNGDSPEPSAMSEEKPEAKASPTSAEADEYIEQPSSVSEASESHESEGLEHEEAAENEGEHEGAAGVGDDSEIESYDDAYVGENETLDSAHIHGAGVLSEASFLLTLTPEPGARAATPGARAAAPVVEAEAETEHDEAEAESESVHENTGGESKEVETNDELVTQEEPSTIQNGLPDSGAAGDDLENIVNMLEAKLPPRPASVTGSVLSDVASIPDEL